MADNLATACRERCASGKRQSGFTLVELMVVVVILGTLIALVGPDIWNFLFEGNVAAAEQQMANFETSIDSYKMQRKKLPQSLHALTETDGRNPHPIMKRIPLDPWGNEYEYKVLGNTEYEIRCAGEDGLPHTEDDLTWPPTDE